MMGRKIWQGRTGHIWQYNMAHVRWMLGNQVCKPTRVVNLFNSISLFRD